MKILVVCQHYWPEPFPLADICETLVQNGHSVDIITDVPNYPLGYIYPEYKHGKNRRQERNGVKIIRTFTIGRRNNVLFRLLNYFSFAISSTIYALFTKEKYDVVLANQSSPVLMVSAALAYAKKHRKKTVFYCMDLWPASLAIGGVKESSIIYKVFSVISKFLYKRADRILMTSKMFRGYFTDELGIEGQKLGYLPQYAQVDFSNCATEKETDTIDLMFAGNVGAAQSIPTILQAAKLLEDEPTVRFHIVGDGSEYENSIALKDSLGLGNVIFHGRHPIEEMPKFYKMADAMLVTLSRDRFVTLTLPAKVQSYMAAGKPIIASADGEIPAVIKESGCGFTAPSEDAEGLSRAVREFLAHTDKQSLSDAALKFYSTNFTKEAFIEKLEKELQDHCV